MCTSRKADSGRSSAPTFRLCRKNKEENGAVVQPGWNETEAEETIPHIVPAASGNEREFGLARTLEDRRDFVAQFTTVIPTATIGERAKAGAMQPLAARARIRPSSPGTTVETERAVPC